MQKPTMVAPRACAATRAEVTASGAGSSGAFQEGTIMMSAPSMASSPCGMSTTRPSTVATGPGPCAHSSTS